MRLNSRVVITVLTFLVALAWAAAGAISAAQKSTVSPDLERAIAPLSANLDPELFTRLSQRAP
jgi:hypothetical protein